MSTHESCRRLRVRDREQRESALISGAPAIAAERAFDFDATGRGGAGRLAIDMKWL
jgi:hypothetical protein